MPKRTKKNNQNYPSVATFLTKKKNDFIAKKIENRVQQAQKNIVEFQESQTGTEVDQVGGEKENVYEEKAAMAEKKLNYAKKLLRQTSDILLEKDLKIKQLMEKTNGHNIASDSVPTFFGKHVETLEPEDLKTIRSSKPGEKNDSNFVLNIMRALYKGAESKKLEHRTATGRKYKGINKHEITAEKKI